MVRVELHEIENFILKKVSLTVPSGSVYVLIGPNGAGKTTALKVIAGLIKYRGQVLFDGESVDNLPPQERNVGYVPQSNALFPHMTVEENILFGLKNRGARILDNRIVEEYLKLAGIYNIRHRYPLTLSGGEQKKVAIIRALVVNPKVLLLDEPFTGIHYDTRMHLVEILKNIKKHRKTIILVTHDLNEALELGDYFGILVNGKLLYTGDKRGFFNSVCKYLGYVNVLECDVREIVEELGLYKIDCSGITITAPLDKRVDSTGKIILTIPADKLVVYKSSICYPSINCIRGVVTSNTDSGSGLRVIQVRLDNDTTLKVIGHYDVSVNERVFVKIPLEYARTYVF